MMWQPEMESQQAKMTTPVKGSVLQRAAINPSLAHDLPPIVHEVLRPPRQPLDTVSDVFTKPRFEYNFSKILVSPVRPGIQTRLVIGKPGDKFEQEANSVADLVMRTPLAGRERVQPRSVSIGSESLHRALEESIGDAPATEPVGEEEAEGNPEQVATLLLETDDLDEDAGNQRPTTPKSSITGTQDESMMQAQEIPGQMPTVSPQQATRIKALRGSGQPLSVPSRAFFESRFGHDLSHVRIHTGAEASSLSRSVQAKAFTVGRDMVFGEGYYQPTSPTGQWLMAHELTHVLQQQEGLSRSPAGGIHVQHTGQPQVQGGFFGDVWSGIKKGASAVGSGIKKAASATWGGIKWAAGKAWSGIKAVGGWSWNVLKSGAALVWNLVTKFPESLWRLIKHLGSGIAGVASWLWEGLKLAWHLNFKGLGKWLLDGILSGAAWVGRLIGKLVDIAGLGEVWDLLFQIIKFNTRPLTSGEKSEAQKTFKNSISYWQVRVDEYSLIAAIGSLFKGGGGMGVTIFHTINFNQKITATPGSSDMHWLTHELTHVSQYEHVGSQYLGEAIHAQATTGYNYGGPGALWRPTANASPNLFGKHFNQFNREQQADIAADYYFSFYGVSVPSGAFIPVQSDYEPVIDELRAGDM